MDGYERCSPSPATKEQLAGHYTLNCKDLDEAIKWASRPQDASAVQDASRSVRRGMAEIQAGLDQLFRRESGRILSGLTRIARSFDLAEVALQDAFAAALVH